MKVCAEFETAAGAIRALKTLKSLGYLDIETHAPFAITDEAAYAPRGSFPLAFLAFGGGVSALGAAYLVQWWANVWSYAINIGGRPAHAGAAFVPSTFESICLFAALGLFAGFLLLERLPRLWQPLFEIEGFERAVVDRFWLVLDVGRDTPIDRITGDVVPLEPVRIVISEGD